MGRVLVTPPAVEPLSLTEAKGFLRIDPSVTVEDTRVTALIVAARAYVENRTGRALITQTWKAYYDRFPLLGYRDTVFTVPLLPLQSVTHIKYYDTGGALVTLAASEYDVDLANGRILSGADVAWPLTQYVLNAIEVQFVAGYGNTAADVPTPFKLAMELIIRDWYHPTSVPNVDDAVDALLGPVSVLAVA